MHVLGERERERRIPCESEGGRRRERWRARVACLGRERDACLGREREEEEGKDGGQDMHVLGERNACLGREREGIEGKDGRQEMHAFGERGREKKVKMEDERCKPWEREGGRSQR